MHYKLREITLGLKELVKEFYKLVSSFAELSKGRLVRVEAVQ